MQWDPFEEYKNRNMMWFNMYKPDKTQKKILHSLSNKQVDYNDCGLFNLGTKHTKNDELFILTHPIVEEIINNKSVHIPLGYIHFQTFPEFEFKYNNEKYSVFYVHSRCSFGMWPEFKHHIKAISDIEHQKVNIGQTLNLFLEGMAKKYKIEHNIDYVILFNMSLADAVYSHEKNGWSEGADTVLSHLIEEKHKKTAAEIFEELELLDHDDEYKMFKII